MPPRIKKKLSSIVLGKLWGPWGQTSLTLSLGLHYQTTGQVNPLPIPEFTSSVACEDGMPPSGSHPTRKRYLDSPFLHQYEGLTTQ